MYSLNNKRPATPLSNKEGFGAQMTKIRPYGGQKKTLFIKKHFGLLRRKSRS